MECKKCGFKNKGGSAYCTQCGEKLPDVKFRNFVIIVGVLLFCFILSCVTKRNNVENNVIIMKSMLLLKRKCLT